MWILANRLSELTILDPSRNDASKKEILGV